MAYTAYNFGHDEVDYATQAVKKWSCSRPTARYFGPTSPEPSGTIFHHCNCKIQDLANFPSNLFLTKSFAFKSPATAVFASFSVTTFNKVTWLGGGGYNQFALHVHGVEYKKRDASSVIGTYIPVLFEDPTDSIVNGREDNGLAKVYRAIAIHNCQKSY
jgi:hypothetical protein